MMADMQIYDDIDAGPYYLAEDVSKVVVDVVTSDLITGQVIVVDAGLGIKG